MPSGSKKKYFESVGTKNWVFEEYTTNSKGKVEKQRLIDIQTINIVRHAKVRSAANPFHPAWEQYFEDRLAKKLFMSSKGRAKFTTLWKKQNGKCGHCKTPITEETGWHRHHIIPKVLGGSDKIDNLVLVHPTCHVQIHSSSCRAHKALEGA